MMGYSVPHFHRIFTAEVGENISVYIRRVRLERAAHKLIKGAVDLTRIASEAGYKSDASFSKAFKRYHKYTPGEFRRLKFVADLQSTPTTESGESTMIFIPSLTFSGNCREALTFYAALFNGSVNVFLPWDPETIANIPEATEEHIMNGSITVDGCTILGSDQFGEMYSPAGNMSLMVEVGDVVEAEEKFTALAEGGQTYMPFGETFWAQGYGYCADRFGILWQVNCTRIKGQKVQS